MSKLSHSNPTLDNVLGQEQPRHRRVLDLFSGIGGFSIGLERAGFQTVAFCEVDPFCRKVLAKHWPGVTIHNDVKQLDGSLYAGSVEIVCGGYPCQPFSHAGKQQGEADPRHLWPEMFRVIRECRPHWVIAENVRGHINLGFDTVATQLEDEGFTVWPFVVPACSIGAPHRRERLWILAHSGDNRQFRGQEQDKQTAHGQQASFGHDVDRCHDRGGRVNVDPETDGREQCNWWVSEPGVGRVADGLPNRVDRLHALGNAVVPQIPELIGRAMNAYEQQIGLAA